MNWSKVTRHYGFQKPYNFKVALPFLLNLIVMATIVITGAVFSLESELNIGTERFYFLTYIFFVSITAIVFSRLFALSLAAFFWCAIELSLALGSNVQEQYGLGVSLFPKNHYPLPDFFRPRFHYHPLLQVAPTPNEQVVIQYETRLKNVYKTPLNWAELEKQMRFSHNSLGLRGAELTPQDLKKDLIFVFGGSTTYDWTVTDGSTWIERLQTDLDNRYTILNFGSPGHSTTEHVVHTAFYENILGKLPVCTIYYVGWNDISSTHVGNVDPVYSNWHTLALAMRKPEIWAEKYSPVVRLVAGKARRRFDSVPEAPHLEGRKPVAGPDDELERIFAEHIATIAAINNARGIKSVFIGQMLNREFFGMFKPDGNDGFSPLIRNSDIWATQARFNSIMKSTAISQGAKYIDPGIENFHYGDFVDHGHFSAAGSRKFAALIAKEVDADCHTE